MLLTVTCKAVLTRDGRILLLRVGARGGSTLLAGTFDLPGGRLRAGESFAEVLQREVWEECGLDLGYADGAAPDLHPAYVGDVRLPAAPSADGTSNKTYEAAQAVLLVFRGDAPAGDPTLGYEHDDYLWVAPADAAELVLFPGVKAALAALAKN